MLDVTATAVAGSNRGCGSDRNMAVDARETGTVATVAMALDLAAMATPCKSLNLPSLY